ncbi:glycosyltransferase [Bradyrhizobium sp. BEA-2-5]|uniref:glycosyltransferase n=1 Tax=Bradyrhizobium sp. BEA-2-5 TaxID=3080015 RepID=UPI00293F6310|nr:glycosyltransferase [Bradyrhizobium sp. BEA-2-5]WOH83354.1 glycosyltransferase [Bradyrhizobium sp. BEA-2-5]
MPDLRPHLAEAAVVVVPLRLGGGTRLKIVEAMAMGKAIVSTTLGAEGIEAVPDRDIMIADDVESFAARVSGLLGDADRAADLGRSARLLAESKYAWSSAAHALEGFYRTRLAISCGTDGKAPTLRQQQRRAER